MCEKQDKGVVRTQPSKLTSSLKKRRKRARKVNVQPRKLFQEEEEEEASHGRKEAEEATGGEEQESEPEPAPSPKEASEQSMGSCTDDEEDEDVFGGDFTYQTPLNQRRKEKKKKDDANPDSAPSGKSKASSLLDVTPGEGKAMAEADELVKKVDKKIMDCLPAQMNPFLGRMSVLQRESRQPAASEV